MDWIGNISNIVPASQFQVQSGEIVLNTFYSVAISGSPSFALPILEMIEDILREMDNKVTVE